MLVYNVGLKFALKNVFLLNLMFFLMEFVQIDF